MADDRMVVVDGVRYRPEDAKRLGVVADAPAKARTKPKHHKAVLEPEHTKAPGKRGRRRARDDSDDGSTASGS